MTDFDGLCRLCLKPSKERMVNVSHFDDLIKQIAKLKLVKHPLIPYKLCQTCSGIILAAGMLRINAVESNRYFMEYLESKEVQPLSEDELFEWEAELELIEHQEMEQQTKTEMKSDGDTKSEEVHESETAPNASEDVEMALVGEIMHIDPETGYFITQYDLNGTNSDYIIVSNPTSDATGNENIEPNNQIVSRMKENSMPAPPPSKNCRLCLNLCKYLPEENGLHFMKQMIKKIMPMKKFQGSPSVRVPDRLCDDCMGKLLIASDIADKASTAYEYFHTKLESGDILTISQNLCCVCLTEFNDENEITRMSNITESYFHLIASRNSKFKDELNFEKQICLKCVHDLELTNAIRYKNWKSEKVLELQFGGAKKSSSSTDNQIWIWDNDTDSDDCSEEPRDFTSRSLNPKLTQVADCQYCLAQFPSESSLRTHLHDAHIPISSECVQCGLKLVSERGAKLHYLSVHMRFVEAICDICGRTYHSQNKLNKHRIIHFEDRNVPCPLCPAKFKRKDNLKIHLRVHSGEKPFKCNYCEKRYAHHTDLKRHTFTHTSQYPFICKFCKAGFCKKAELKAHEEEHNPFDPNRKIKEAQIEYKEK